ncbi:hypothetical protein FRC16_008642 [Serendipita sp. 398]|nr:hypothetical protein FRC16_008642 [Serendipita sp. 398]
MDVDDPIVSVIPIQLSSILDPNLQLHQYPLSSRPLEVPPSARDAGKVITARIKPLAERIEVHIPFDTREEVWNQRRGFEYGDARREEDGKKPSGREEHRLEELRLRSEKVPHRGTYMIGLLRGDRLHLHPISATYKLRPHLGYIDVLSQRLRRRPGDGEEDEGGNDAGEDEEDDKPKRGKREAKEVHLLARKTDGSVSSSMSDMRREMLKTLAAEEFEPWIPIKYADEVHLSLLPGLGLFIIAFFSPSA